MAQRKEWPLSPSRARLEALYFVAMLLLTPALSIGAPVTTAPEGDLDADGLVTSLDVDCLALLWDAWILAQPVITDQCDVDLDCAAGEACRPAFGGEQICVPDCLAADVSMGFNSELECDDPCGDSPSCLGLVQRRNADLNCDGDITNVDFQFLSWLLVDGVPGGGDSRRGRRWAAQLLRHRLGR